MCLTIDLNKHPDLKPIRLDKDLLVHKYLCNKNDVPGYYRERFMTKYVTPFMYAQVHFLFGKAILRAELDEPNACCIQIDRGIHSMKVYMYSDVFIHHKAIIPKGSLVYYGTDGDVVSNKLIIFKNK